MSRLRWYYSVDSSTVLEITNRVRLPLDPEGVAIAVGAQADGGAGWEGDLLVDDTAGDFIPLMFRRIYCNDDDAPAGGQVVGNWFISNLKVTRKDPFAGAARVWTITMADENSLLSRRKFVGSDANRPAETDIARLRWALTTTELNVLDPDETYIDTANPVNLDAADLRQQGPDEMMDSLMKASLKSYGVMYREDLTPHVYSLWYFNQNTSELYQSTVKLSNVASEIGVPTSTLVYPLSGDAELDRAGGRMASGMLGKYKTNWIYIEAPAVGERYAYVDRVAADNNTSSLAAATAEFTHQLDQLQFPDDEITTTVTVESDNLNLIKHGMRIQVHATHFPNYTDDSDPLAPEYQLPGYAADYVWCRVIERTIRQVGPTTFEMPLRLSPQRIIPTSPAFCCLTWPSNGNAHNLSHIEWSNSGDTPKGGDPTYPNSIPTSGLVSKIVGDEKPWKGILIGGTGTVDVTVTSSFNTVVGAGTHTANFDIRKNGTMVARTQYIKTFTGLGSFNATRTVNVSAVAVVPGDIIDHIITVDGSTGPGLFTVPIGTGTYDQRMVLTGSLA